MSDKVNHPVFPDIEWSESELDLEAFSKIVPLPPIVLSNEDFDKFIEVINREAL